MWREAFIGERQTIFSIEFLSQLMSYHLRDSGRFIQRHWVISALLIIVLVFFMTSYRLERLLVYYPLRQIDGDPGDLGLQHREISLLTEDHIKLHGWFVACEGARKTVLIFHGNGGNISHRLSLIELLHNSGVHVFIVDYRGYGRSEGEPFEEGLYRDAHAAYNWWAKERQSAGENIVILGESLGGAVAVHLAARVPVAGLILQSTFTSARDMAKTMFPTGLLLPLIGVRFNSEKDIAQVHCPKLIVHGTRDEIVPFELGKALFEAAPPPKSFYVVPEAGHNDLLSIAGTEYSRKLEAFLSGIP